MSSPSRIPAILASMPTHRPREPFNALVLAALAVVVTAVLIAAGGGSRRHAAAAGDPSWQGLAGAQRPRVAVGRRVIVLLKAAALADRVGNAGGLATGEEERQWTQSALSAQKLLVARLRVQGVVVQPEFSYTRAVNGFSAAFDARGIALLERAPDVAGVYPVRAAYPASLSSRLLTTTGFGERPNISLSDKDGRGVTIALRPSCAGVSPVGSTSSEATQVPSLRHNPASPPNSNGTAPRWPASSSAPAGLGRSPASPREPPSCRSALLVGSET